jgi:cell division protein FtsW (lipid II flippase)
MRATLAYTSARILLFIVAAGLLYLAGVRGILVLILALVVSALASYVVLSPQRDKMSEALDKRIRTFRERIDEGTESEDDD